MLLADDPDVRAAINGELKAQSKAAYRIAQAQLKVEEQKKVQLAAKRKRASARRRTEKSSFASPRYLGAICNLVHREAQREQVEILSSFRSILSQVVEPLSSARTARRAKRYPDQEEKILEANRRVIARHGLRHEDDHFEVLASIAESEAKGSFNLAEGLMGIVESVIEASIGSADCPLSIQNLYLDFPRSVSPKTGRVGVVEVSGGKDGNDIQVLPYSIPNGFLHSLDLASAVIALKYQWTKSAAVSFILSDWHVPTVKIAKIDYDFREAIPALTRVSITVDPTLTPEEVLAIYSFARDSITSEGRMIKSLSDKSCALANFVYGQTHTPTNEEADTDTWKDLMHLWNGELSGGWIQVESQRGASLKYDRVALFREHSERARERLLFPPIDPPANLLVFPSLKDIGGEPPKRKETLDDSIST